MITIRRRCGRWYWCCTYCQPTTTGSRNTWTDIIRISLPRHFRVRYFHHQWAAHKPVT